MREDFKPLKTTNNLLLALFNIWWPWKGSFLRLFIISTLLESLYSESLLLHRLGMLCIRLQSSSGVTMWCQAWIIFSISSLLLDGLFLAMITLILCHKFSIGLRSGDFLANSSGPPYEIASTFSLTLLDGREHCHLEISSIHPEINFGSGKQFCFQHSSLFVGIHHPLTAVQSSNAIWCHTTPNHHK